MVRIHSVRPNHVVNGEKRVVYFCAGINQCVGIYNERHFVLFMYVRLRDFNPILTLTWPVYRAYLVLSTFCYCFLGYGSFLDSLGITYSREVCPFYLLAQNRIPQLNIPALATSQP